MRSWYCCTIQLRLSKSISTYNRMISVFVTRPLDPTAGTFHTRALHFTDSTTLFAALYFTDELSEFVQFCATRRRLVLCCAGLYGSGVNSLYSTAGRGLCTALMCWCGPKFKLSRIFSNFLEFFQTFSNFSEVVNNWATMDFSKSFCSRYIA